MIWQGPFCKGNIYGKGQSKVQEFLLERGAGREIIHLIIKQKGEKMQRVNNGLVWIRARILALVNSATLTVNYGVK